MNSTDTDGDTALMLASYFGHEDVVALLIKAGKPNVARIMSSYLFLSLFA